MDWISKLERLTWIIHCKIYGHTWSCLASELGTIAIIRDKQVPARRCSYCYRIEVYSITYGWLSSQDVAYYFNNRVDFISQETWERCYKPITYKPITYIDVEL
jgi:hypothetical protein